jgi:taurine dioxygenase
MSIHVEPSGQACGATITRVDLSKPMSDGEVAEIRAAWLKHHVLAFPDQPMSDDDLERFSLCFGDFGDDPFIAPIAGRDHVIAVMRTADEEGPIFAEAWHTDWSFQEIPPAGTCLMAVTIPPKGGDTLFVDQHLALEKMPSDLRAKLEGKRATHSAAGAYAPDGFYGTEDEGTRSMDIRPSEAATATMTHQIVRPHPETGELGLYGCVGYITGIEGMDPEKASALVGEMYAWQTREEFQYRNKWSENMLVMWDNRSVLHSASGGYEGYDRVLHRTTIADKRR